MEARMHDGAPKDKKDPYRKLEVIQGEGPTLCVDCVYPRTENSGRWIHPKNIEEKDYKDIAFQHASLWRCVGTPNKDIDFVTGLIDMSKVPTCKKHNDGECVWFAEYLEPEKPTDLVPTKKKPWWKFW